MPPIIMLVAMLASATLVIFGLRSGGQRRRGILFLTGYGILLIAAVVALVWATPPA